MDKRRDSGPRKTTRRQPTSDVHSARQLAAQGSRLPTAEPVAVAHSPSRSTAAKTLDFPEAIRAVIGGARVTKQEWANPSIYLEQAEGFLKIRKADGTLHALLVSDGDLSGTDWLVLKPH